VVVNGTIIDTTPPAIPTGLVLVPTVENLRDRRHHFDPDRELGCFAFG
jgi:hypothetical protein